MKLAWKLFIFNVYYFGAGGGGLTIWRAAAGSGATGISWAKGEAGRSEEEGRQAG